MLLPIGHPLTHIYTSSWATQPPDTVGEKRQSGGKDASSTFSQHEPVTD